MEKASGKHHSPNHTIKRKLRVCLDPRDLNEALEREPYHTHSVDEITAKLQGMTVFIIVDFKKGYWMVVLHPESRKLTCMALPFGRFQWTRLPMGTVVAQDIFQSKLDSSFISMEGVTGIADDMVIAGTHEMEHDRNFTQYFTRSKEDQGTQSHGIPTGQGNYEIFPRDDQLPQQVQCTQCTPCSTLSALTHQAVDYKPGKVHFENFNRLKVEILNMKALPYFGVNAVTTLQMDASKKGLGACLIQKGNVICYASRALTKTEQNYQNLERERGTWNYLWNGKIPLLPVWQGIHIGN